MKIVAGLLLFLSSFASMEASQASDIAYFTRLAKELRVDTKKDPLKEEDRIDHLCHEILGNVPDFGDVGIEQAVEELMEEVLDVNPKDYQIVDSVKTRLSGKSKAKVLFIFDEQNRMKWVVKAFPRPDRPRSGFLAELSGMSLIKERHLSTVVTVNPLAVCKCREDESEYGLLLESVAPGERADQFIHMITQYSKDDPLREKNLKTSCRMCLAIGAGLADFHGVDGQQRAALKNTGLLMAKIEMDQLLTAEVIAQLKGELDVDGLKRFIKRKLSGILKMSSGKFFRHGDADTKNIFYDTKKNNIVFIDVARIHYFVNKSGHPLANNIEDLFHFHKKFVEECDEMLSQSECHQLNLALCQGYTDFSHVSQLSHGNIYEAIAAIARYCFCDSLADPVERNRQNALLQTYIDFINRIIEAD